MSGKRVRDEQDEVPDRRQYRLIQAAMLFEKASVEVSVCLKDIPSIPDSIFNALTSNCIVVSMALDATKSNVSPTRTIPYLPSDVLTIIFDFMLNNWRVSQFVQNKDESVSVYTQPRCNIASMYPLRLATETRGAIHPLRLVSRQWSYTAERFVDCVRIPCGEVAIKALTCAEKRWKGASAIVFGHGFFKSYTCMSKDGKERVDSAMRAYFEETSKYGASVRKPVPLAIFGLSARSRFKKMACGAIFSSSEYGWVMSDADGRMHASTRNPSRPKYFCHADVIHLSSLDPSIPKHDIDALSTWNAEFWTHNLSFSDALLQYVGKTHPIVLRYILRGKGTGAPKVAPPMQFAHGSTLIIHVESPEKAHDVEDAYKLLRIFVPFTHVRIHCESTHDEVELNDKF